MVGGLAMMRRMGRVVLVLVVVGLAANVKGGDSKELAGPQLGVAACGPSLKHVGPKRVFRVKVCNPGDQPAKHLLLTYQISRSHKLLAASDQGRYDAKTRTITWQWDQLAAGCAREFQLELEAVGSSEWCHKIMVTADGGLKSETDCGSRLEGSSSPTLHPSTGYGRDADILMRMVTPRIIINEEEEERATGHNAGGPQLEVELMPFPLKLRYGTQAFHVRVSNPGDRPAEHVVVSYQIPPGLKLLIASDGSSFDSKTRTITWKWDKLAPHAENDLFIGVDLVYSSVWDHAVSVVADGGVKAETGWAQSVEGISALLLEMEEPNSPVEVGATASYRARVCNTNHSVPERNLRVAFNIPPGFQFEDASGPTRFAREGSDVLFEPLKKLAGNSEVAYEVRLKVISRKADNAKVKATLTRDDAAGAIIEASYPLRVASGSARAPN
jgi:hypothetical protein